MPRTPTWKQREASLLARIHTNKGACLERVTHVVGREEIRETFATHHNRFCMMQFFLYRFDLRLFRFNDITHFTPVEFSPGVSLQRWRLFMIRFSPFKLKDNVPRIAPLTNQRNKSKHPAFPTALAASHVQGSSLRQPHLTWRWHRCRRRFRTPGSSCRCSRLRLAGSSCCVGGTSRNWRHTRRSFRRGVFHLDLWLHEKQIVHRRPGHSRVALLKNCRPSSVKTTLRNVSCLPHFFSGTLGFSKSQSLTWHSDSVVSVAEGLVASKVKILGWMTTTAANCSPKLGRIVKL